MSSGCGDVLSLEDLKTAKKHQTFEAEVITGRAGGVSNGDSIDYATNQVTGQVQKTMPAILRDIGFRPASFDFVTGGTIGINDRDLAVLWPLPGGDADWYYWEGALPKVIPASSTPLTTGGIADGAWRPVGDITLRTQLASTDGANLVMFTPLSGAERLLQDYLREGYIRVSSRDELIAAQTVIKTAIHKRTEVRLSRNFSPWNAAQTDIDLAYVTIVGEGDGVFIDATGIPNVDGNYWLRLYNSNTPETLINNLPFLEGSRLKGVSVRGPGRSSNVAGLRWHSPEGSLGNISWAGVQIQEFSKGVSFEQNAYIIHGFGCYILRCNTYCVGMDSGFSNYGENIAFFGSTLGVSGGVAVYCNNPNGGFNFYGTSVDYSGQIANATAGYITFYGGHHEVENSANPTTGPLYVTGNHTTARIVCDGVKQVCYRSAGLLQNHIVKTDVGDGVYFINCMSQNMRTVTGQINTGTGIFSQVGTQVQAGGGNIQTSIKQTDLQSLVLDGTSETTNVYDWYISRVNNAVTSRVSGDNITLANSTDIALDGSKSLKVTKSSGGTNHGVSMIVPISVYNQYHYLFNVYPISGTTGSIFTDSFFVALNGYNSLGIPVIAKTTISLGPRTTTLTGSTSWQSVQSFASKFAAPSWATHMLISINSSGLSVGGYYIDSYGVWGI